jgi:hypothetical protein
MLGVDAIYLVHVAWGCDGDQATAWRAGVPSPDMCVGKQSRRDMLESMRARPRALGITYLF